MSESRFAIPIPETDLFVKGFYREVTGAPLVVLVHGFTGHCNEALFFMAARAFETAGYSTVRFNLYGEPDERVRLFTDCTIETHAFDLDLVVDTFRSMEPQRTVSVVGHSLGGLTVLSSTQRVFDVAVLWDPTHGELGDFSQRSGTTWNADIDRWIVQDNVEMIVGAQLAESWRTHQTDVLATALGKPTKVIAASECSLHPFGRRIASAAQAPAAFSIVEGADHNFVNDGTAEVLFVETLDWLNEYGR